MSDISETAVGRRRAHARRPGNSVVLCRSEGAIIRGRMVNVSCSGICFSAESAFTVGDRIDLEFPGKGITVAALVQWVGGSGNRCVVGCRFGELLDRQAMVRLTM